MKIEPNRTYKIAGVDSHTFKGSQIVEALKLNGIPEGLPDPPEVEDHECVVIPLGEELKGGGTKYNTLNRQSKPMKWVYDKYETRTQRDSHLLDDEECIFVQYIPTPIEMTLAEVCVALGKTVKIVK